MNDGHWSDCAVYNEPAYPAGPCNCGGLDLAAYDLYRRVTSLVPTPGSLRAFIGEAVSPSFVEAQELPTCPLATSAPTADLPNAHDGVAVVRGANGVDLNDARVAVIGDGKTLPGAQGLTSNMPPHNDSPDSIARGDSTPGDGA